MKKLIALFIAGIFILTACHSSIPNDWEQNSPVSETETESALPEDDNSNSNTVKPEPEPLIPEDDDAPFYEIGLLNPELWQQLYCIELIEYMNNYPLARFNICDLDGDGIPELLISQGFYHAAGVYIYTVHESELKNLGYYGSYGELHYDSENKYIFSYNFGQGSDFLTVYQLENGEMIQLVSFYSTYGYIEFIPEGYFEINGEEVSGDVYNAEMEKYGFDFNKNEIFFNKTEKFAGQYELTPEEIERVLN
jgi:hypothetical protein